VKGVPETLGKKTKQIVLRKRPSGELEDNVFEFVTADLPQPKSGEILVRTKYLSVDPYMRNRMNNVASYIAPFALDKAICGDGIGEVLQSESESFSDGDLVCGIVPWQDYAVLKAAKVEKIENQDDISPTLYLSALGLTGLTAYFGMLDIGDPKSGETVVVSAAAGAVGSIAGQIAKIQGCNTIGIAGSESKKDYLLSELDFDAAINYKTHPNIRKELKNNCTQKVDIYFDNVGGDISDGVFYWLNDFARIVLCGQIALYNLKRLSMGPRLFPQFIIHRVKMQGFIVYDYADRFREARQQLQKWLLRGDLKYPENIIDGFENTPAALMALFRGDNIGKQLVRV
jgi:NADPH-dependent curcumin reductase CurA